MIHVSYQIYESRTISQRRVESINQAFLETRIWLSSPLPAYLILSVREAAPCGPVGSRHRLFAWGTVYVLVFDALYTRSFQHTSRSLYFSSLSFSLIAASRRCDVVLRAATGNATRRLSRAFAVAPSCYRCSCSEFNRIRAADHSSLSAAHRVTVR